MIVTAVLTFTAFLPLIGISSPIAGMTTNNGRAGDRAILGYDWYYNYNVLPDQQDGGAEFVPYIWCDKWPSWDFIDHVDYIQLAREHYPPDYDGWLLFLNEPDLPGSDEDGGQCGMSPQAAAYLYKAIVTLWPDARLVGPGVSHQDYYNGWQWLRAWYAEIAKLGLPSPERGAIHTYLSGNPNTIIDSYLTAIPQAPNVVWVTEFGHCDTAVAQAMIDTWQTRPDVERYAWYTVRDGGCTDLMANGRLTALGEMWREEHAK